MTTTVAGRIRTELAGFWSYVRKDDKVERGRILQLAHDIADQYEMYTGEKIKLFIDKDRIRWGDKWREEVEASLQTVAFFVPVITPRYFMSPECRNELKFFAQRAKAQGLQELILPLYYIDVSSFTDKSEDDLIRLVHEHQWVDWRKIRFRSVQSPTYREAVHRLVVRLVEANKRIEECNTNVVRLESVPTEEADDEQLGMLDRIAKLEEEVPKLNGTLGRMTQESTVITSVIETATEQLNRQALHDTASARVVLIRRVARNLDEPVNRFESLSHEFTSQLDYVDDGIRTIIGEVVLQSTTDPVARKETCEFFNVIRSVSEEMGTAFMGAMKWAQAISDGREVVETYQACRSETATIVNDPVRVKEHHRRLDSYDRCLWC